jgi:hypothetical protein
MTDLKMSDVALSASVLDSNVLDDLQPKVATAVLQHA